MINKILTKKSHTLSAKLRWHEQLYITALRLSKWEYWPSWVLYLPVVGLGVFQLVRGRGLNFLYANTALPLGGAFADNKFLPLKAIRKANPEYLPDDILLKCQPSALDAFNLLEQWLESAEHVYPIVLKPDTGCRGKDVSIIHKREEARDYLTTLYQLNGALDVVVQTYVTGREFGIFYCNPSPENPSSGFVYSLAEKTFPKIVGDGETPLRQLILSDLHARYSARFLLPYHQDRLSAILSKGESYQIIDLGTHSKGSIFVDKQNDITKALEASVRTVSQAIGGYDCGRLDVRAKDLQALKRGEFKVLEANGVTAEAAHLYSPKTSLFKAWSILFKQWCLAYQSGYDNKGQCKKHYRVKEVLRVLFRRKL